ncbi:MAG: alpha/beta fold hydrolase [Candidatus Limnocylindrales bacterium]
MTDQPAGFVVTVEPGDRIHFLDWGGEAASPGVLLVHGLSQTAWVWSPVARRLAGSLPIVAMDLRGHGLSDAPTEDGAYDLAILAEDAVAAAEGSGVLADGQPVVLVGHGFGAIVAAVAAAGLGRRCAGLVLVDGGWESAEGATGLDADEFLRGLDEPPEILRSMRAFIADRRGYDPATWDDDQDRAARATVVETHAGRVVPAVRPHALEACVRAMFAYDPVSALARVAASVVALIAADADGSRGRALAVASDARVAAGRGPIAAVQLPAIGHNLMRYRPQDVTDAILSLARSAT